MGRYYCSDCEVHLTNHPNCIQEHVGGKRHRKNATGIKATIKIKSKKTVVKKKKPTINNAKSYICDVCQVNVPKAQIGKEQHLRGKRHTRKLRKAGGEVPGHDRGAVFDWHCDVCNVFLTNNDKNIRQHVKSKSHKNKAKADTLINDTYSKKQDYTCDICVVSLPNDDRNISEHLNGKRHKRNVRNLGDRGGNLTTKDGEERLNDDIRIVVKTFYCCICDKYVPNNDKTIQLHVNGKGHNKLFDGLLDRVSSEHNIANIHNLFGTSLGTNTNADGKHVLKNENTGVKPYYCNVCDVDVPDNSFNIQQHIDGRRHRRLSWL